MFLTGKDGISCIYFGAAIIKKAKQGFYSFGVEWGRACPTEKDQRTFAWMCVHRKERTWFPDSN